MTQTTVKIKGNVWMVPDVATPNHFHIMLEYKTVGTIILRNLRDVNTSILDDVDVEEEGHIIYPLFEFLKKENGLYLDEINLKEEYQGMGIGQQIIGNLLKSERPVLVYSLADAEGFWEKMEFEHVCGYYYVWQARERAFY
jgi:GNAT superfamily N-acetyltransferase